MEAPTGSERYCLRWNNYTSNLLQTITEQHMNEKFVDVVLVCECHYIKVHRLILSACSLFFESILESQVGQVFQPYIVLTGVKFEHLKYIVEFMYSGEIRVLDKDIEAVLALGEKLQVKGLCSVVLREKVWINSQELSTIVDPKKTSIPQVRPLPPTVPSATKSTPNDNSLLKRGTSSASHTQKPPNVKTSSTKVLPKIQVRPPSVINASATSTEACCDEVSDFQEDMTQASTKSHEQSLDTSSGQIKAIDILRSAAESSKEQRQTATTPLVHFEAAQSDIVFDTVKKKPTILKRGIKRKMPSPGESENSSDSFTNKTLPTAVKLPLSEPNTQKSSKVSAIGFQITKKIKSKIDEISNKPPDNVASVDTKTKLASPTGVIHEEVTSPNNLVAITVVKEEIQEEESSNRHMLIRDNMDVMKNGTQVPRKVLKEEDRKPVSPFMLFANEWRKKIASEHPDESKREVSLRISQMWKSLEPDSRKVYYRRARQTVKEESKPAQCIEGRKPQNEGVPYADLPRSGSDFEIIICSDGDSLDE